MSLQRYRGLLLRYLQPQRRRVGLLAVLLLASLGVELANPLILRAFIDTARSGAPLDTLIGMAMLFLGIALATQGIAVAETYVAQDVGLTATNQLRADLTRHLLQLDPGFHNARTPGELIERVDGDVATLGNFFSRFVVYLLGNGLLLIGVLVLLFGIDWRVGLAGTVFALLALLVVNALRDVSVPHWTAARQASAELFGFLEEWLAGTEDIRANGATAYALRRLYARSHTLIRRQRTAGVIGAATGSTTIVLLSLGTAVALGVGGYLFTAGTITLGTVYLIFSYTDLLRRPVEQITRQMQDLQQAGASVARIQDLLDTRSAIVDGPGNALPAGPLAVAFERVTFGYTADEPVVQDLSFTLAPGRVLGVLGRTGSGKTTLTRLLFRLYDPQQGAILLHGADLRAGTLADLRTRVGMVTQEIQLFHASVRDNLAFFDRTLADARIVAVLEELGLGPWYQALPHGLDTKLAPGGSGLSAGQAQLVAFARVFLKDPGLVILDEASSRLDPATEAQVEHAVDRLLTGRTGIIIAHRLGTVERADHILILDDGRIAEYGPRAALAADPGSRFARLLQTGLEEVLV
ncbi:MAG TPA: ABC transporter ATP-binding protein [Chloroflexia bacterium]|nr:ABC transporter ATP-binding protein [Chloroflexia bacterium]